MYIHPYYTWIRFDWSPAKSEWLKRKRGKSFEEIVLSTFVCSEDHPRRQHQKYLLFEVDGYIWSAPAVLGDGIYFLKTAFPNRVFMRKWIRGEL